MDCNCLDYYLVLPVDFNFADVYQFDRFLSVYPGGLSYLVPQVCFVVC